MVTSGGGPDRQETGCVHTYGPSGASGRNATLLAAGLICLLIWGWVDTRQRAIPETGRQGQMTDITVYLEAARAMRAGNDLYQVRNVRNWPYLYPPLPALLFVPMSYLSRGQASYVWFLASLACLVCSVLLMRAALRRFDPRVADRACWVGLLPLALPMFHTLQRGQINALPLLCACLAIYAMATDRQALSGMALAGAAAIKITPGFAIVYFVHRWLTGQVEALRSRTWRPATLATGSRPLFGFALGLVLGLWLVPALYMGPYQAAGALASWRQTAGAGYFRPDADGNLFGDTPGVHDSSPKNQSWYRAIFSTVSLLDPDALQSRDLLCMPWQQRIKWILAAVGVAITAGLLWLSTRSGLRPGGLGPCKRWRR